jgi:enediyne biosynthesis protein E4
VALGLPGVALAGCRDPHPAAIAAPAGRDTSSAFHFTDAQDSANVRFTHTDGGSGRHFFVEQFCSGCGFIDYDNDGWLDIYAVDGAPLPGMHADQPPRHRFWRNRRDGTFEDVTEKAGLGSTRFGGGVCAGDYNNDGHTDLFVTCFGKNHLYRNMGDGTFRDVAEEAGVADDAGIHTSACFVDYDNDGWLDLYVCRYVEYSLDKDRFCGKGNLHKSYCGPEVFPSRHDILYKNNRDGTFTDVSRASGIIQPRSKSLGVVATDLDNDGWMDLYVTCDLEPNLLLMNNRDGTFRETGVSSGVAYNVDGAALAGMGVASGDYDNDGRMDLFVTNYSFEMNSLFRNMGNGSFDYESIRTGIGPPSLVPLGFGAQFADFDNDGWLDVIVANGHVLDNCNESNQALEYAQKLQVYRNFGGTRFEDVSAASGPAFQQKYIGRGLAVGDYNNDGLLDFLVNDNKGPLRLIRNETQTGNRWLRLQLQGTRANRSAIGARVEVVTRNGRRTGEVKSGSSYLSQGDLRLHFGLADADTADEVHVRWPGSGGKPGATETWRNLASNQTHTLIEGKGT